MLNASDYNETTSTKIEVIPNKLVLVLQELLALRTWQEERAYNRRSCPLFGSEYPGDFMGYRTIAASLENRPM